MRKWLPPILAALSVAMVLPTPAGAARDRRCSLDLNFLTAPVSVTGNPLVNGTETRAATVDGKLCGAQFRGAARLVITYTAPGMRTIRFAIFGSLGSLEGSVLPQARKFEDLGILAPETRLPESQAIDAHARPVSVERYPKVPELDLNESMMPEPDKATVDAK